MFSVSRFPFPSPQSPSPQVVLFAPQGSAALGSLRGRLRTQLVSRVEELLRPRAPALEKARRHRLALTSVKAGRALLRFIETGVPAAQRREMTAELRAMLVAYFAPWVGTSPAAAAS